MFSQPIVAISKLQMTLITQYPYFLACQQYSAGSSNCSQQVFSLVYMCT